MACAIVVGAGVAGISAAVHLTVRGWRVVLVEARSAVGGRATSVWDVQSGEFIDCGQHVFIGAYREFGALLRHLHTYSLAGPGDALRFLFCRRDGSFLFDTGRAPGPLGFVAALSRMPDVGFPERLRLLRALLWLIASGNRDASSTVAAFLQRFRQSEQLVATFWRPLTLSALNASPEEAAVALLRVVLREGFLAAWGGSAFFVPAVSLLELLQPIGDWLARHGGELRLRTPVTRVVLDSAGACAVHTATGQLLKADAVILAVPPWGLLRLAPALCAVPAYAEFLTHARYSPIITAYLWLKEPVLPAPVCAFVHPDLHWAFRRPTRFAAESVALVTSAADHLCQLSRQRLLERLLAAFAEGIPTFRPDMLLHVRLMVERRATVLLTPALHARRPDGTTPWGNLMVAGDWIQTGLPCTLESAARSGRMAAEKLTS